MHTSNAPRLVAPYVAGRCADLNGARNGAHLEGAALAGADLREANIARARIRAMDVAGCPAYERGRS